MTSLNLPARGITRLYPSEYRVWVDMRWRCSVKTYKRYKDYGGRGIAVCERWQNSFRNFLLDMGPRPGPKFSLDRIDNDGDYYPENCRWATRREQQGNTRQNRFLTYRGETHHIKEWSRRTGIHRDVIASRLDRGDYTVEEALETPPYGKCQGALEATINGRTQSVRRWAKEFGFRDIGIVYNRMARGWSVERALLTPARKYNRG